MHKYQLLLAPSPDPHHLHALAQSVTALGHLGAEGVLFVICLFIAVGYGLMAVLKRLFS